MKANELMLQPICSKSDVCRSYEFITNMAEANLEASKSPTVRRYAELFSSVVRLGHVYKHDGFRPALLLERESKQLVGLGSIALQKTVFHPADGQITGAELDYVVTPESDDATRHIEAVELLGQYHQELRGNGTNGRPRSCARFSSLTANAREFQPHGVSLMPDAYYEIPGAGQLEVDADACLVAKNNAIVNVFHSK